MVRVVSRQALRASSARPDIGHRKKPLKVVREAVTQDKKLLRTVASYVRDAPPGYVFVAVGRPDFTKYCTEKCRKRSLQFQTVNATPLSKANLDPQKVSHHIHRIGNHFPEDVVTEACEKLGFYSAGRGKFIRYNADLERRMNANNEGADPLTIRDAIKELFPNIPLADLNNVLKHAFRKGSKRVGNANMPLTRKVQLAVSAFVRHQYTDYDKLLGEKVSWKEARAMIEPDTLRQLKVWRGEAFANSTDEDSLRDIIVLDDDSDDPDVDSAEAGDTGDDSVSVEFISENVCAREPRVGATRPVHRLDQAYGGTERVYRGPPFSTNSDSRKYILEDDDYMTHAYSDTSRLPKRVHSRHEAHEIVHENEMAYPSSRWTPTLRPQELPSQGLQHIEAPRAYYPFAQMYVPERNPIILDRHYDNNGRIPPSVQTHDYQVSGYVRSHVPLRPQSPPHEEIVYSAASRHLRNPGDLNRNLNLQSPDIAIPSIEKTIINREGRLDHLQGQSSEHRLIRDENGRSIVVRVNPRSERRFEPYEPSYEPIQKVRPVESNTHGRNDIVDRFGNNPAPPKQAYDDRSYEMTPALLPPFDERSFNRHANAIHLRNVKRYLQSVEEVPAMPRHPSPSGFGQPLPHRQSDVRYSDPSELQPRNIVDTSTTSYQYDQARQPPAFHAYSGHHRS